MSNRAFPKWLINFGSVLVFLSALLAARLVYEQTFLTWKRGPQMVGYSFFHGGIGILCLLALYAGLGWVALTALFAFLRRSLGGPVNVALLALYGLSWVLVSVPYEWWELRMVESLGPWEHGAKALKYADPQQTSLIQTLVEGGSDVNYADQYNHTTLHSAVNWGRPEIVELLLSHGARVNEKERLRGRTPLLNAVDLKYAEIARLLLAYGAEPGERDADGMTAYDLANQNAEMLQILTREGAAGEGGLKCRVPAME